MAIYVITERTPFDPANDGFFKRVMEKEEEELDIF